MQNIVYNIQETEPNYKRIFTGTIHVVILLPGYTYNLSENCFSIHLIRVQIC
jgi:hypothetical protein